MNVISTQQSESRVRWWIVFLALVGIAVASLALREHYRVGASPCSINDRWDCGTVNHSPYAVLARVPVAVIGIGGYALLGLLAAIKAVKPLFFTALVGIAFSLYLTRIEAYVLEVWCIYCVASLATITLITISSGITLAMKRSQS
jgi:vitamin-K-epoxide reductase (warfarin-sensitive)